MIALAVLVCFSPVSRSAHAQGAEPVPAAALDGPPGDSGLHYVYYEGDFDTVLDLEGQAPAREGTIASFAFPEGIRRDQFGLELFGAVEVPSDGTYTFTTTSDDGSRLYIGTTLVVANDYPHGAQKKEGSVGLKAGRHPIYVAYFEGVVDEVLEVTWKGPGVDEGPIPESALTQYPKVVAFPADGVTTTELEWPDRNARLSVTVDTRDAPDASFLAQAVPDTLREYYPTLLSLLAVEGQELPSEVRFSVRPDVGNPAYASGGRIVLDAGWFAAHPGDLGCIVHEVAHLVQAYRGFEGMPAWLVEGIADYARHQANVGDGWRIPDAFREGTSYTNGYGITAAFLVYLEGRYDPKLVRELHLALKDGTYKPSLFEDLCGKPLDDLWVEYAAAPGTAPHAQ